MVIAVPVPRDWSSRYVAYMLHMETTAVNARTSADLKLREGMSSSEVSEHVLDVSDVVESLSSLLASPCLSTAITRPSSIAANSISK